MKEEPVTALFKVMVERGLVDEAARSVHDANLGMTLKHLAMHVKGERNISVKDEPGKA